MYVDENNAWRSCHSRALGQWHSIHMEKWKPCYGNRISMHFFSAIEVGSNSSGNAKEDTTVSFQLVLQPASIRLRNSIKFHVNSSKAG